MVFNPNIPTAPQKLSVSQPLLLANNQQLDTSFGIDHYKYSDATANNGFHNSVTTPGDQPVTDPVTVANPVFYALENTVNLGLLQYSRGPSNAVPTPVMSLHFCKHSFNDSEAQVLMCWILQESQHVFVSFFTHLITILAPEMFTKRITITFFSHPQQHK